MLLYDGDCAFCTASARRISARWRGPATAVAWQRLGGEGLARLGLTVSDVEQAAWWVQPDGSRSAGHLAIAHALIASGGWRAAIGRLLGAKKLRWAFAPAYRAVARHRHRLPGATEACRRDG